MPLSAVIALVFLALGGVLVAFLLWSHAKTRRIERERLLLDARLVASNVSRQLEATSLLLDLVRNELSGNPERPQAGSALDARLKLLTASLKGVRSAHITDRRGEVIASSWPGRVGMNPEADERYSTISGRPDASLLYISQPFKTLSGVWSIGLARMIADARGGFNGCILIMLEPEYFEALLGVALHAPDMRAAVIHSDGKFVIQVPQLGASGLDVSKDPNSAAMRHLQSHQESSVIETVTAADQELRLVATVNVKTPSIRTDKFLAVGLTRKESAIYGEWRQSAMLAGSLYGLMLALVAVGAWMVRKHGRERAWVTSELRRTQQNSEESLREVEHRWRAALEASAEAVWDWDMSQERLLLSPAHERMFGYSLQEIGNPTAAVLSMLHPEDRAALERTFDKRTRDRLDSYHGEFRVRHKDGHLVWIETHGLIIERDSDGKAVRMVGTHRDITERKRLEQQLIDSNQQLLAMRVALENAGTAMYFVAASDGKFSSVNLAAAKMLGYTREELRLLSLATLDEDENATEKYTRILESVLTDEHPRVEVSQRRKDGTCIAVELGFYRLPIVTNTVLVLGLNITERKAAENELLQAKAAAEASSVAKTSFLATVSHEIRTPLNGLTGMLDLLGNTNLDADAKEFVNIARTASRQLRVILNDVLDLSKIEAGKLEFEQVPFDVQGQLGNAVRAFTGAARAKGLQLEISWRTPTRLLLGDPQRVCQIVNNLVDNAIKFTDQGGVEVLVSTHQAASEPDRCDLQVSVSDSGVGVPPDREYAIFDAFTQAEQSITRRFGGTGLGLTLCRLLCRGMGGDIQFRRRPEGGSVFTITIPCRLAHGMSPFVDTQPAELLVGGALSHRRVLVVDDNRVNQTLLKRWLAKENMDVEAVGDGAAGVRAVAHGKFDIVLMDVSMPIMNGMDATRAIRALASSGSRETQDFARLPIIGISANAMLGDKQNCLECGMTDYVTKPIDRRELLSKISRAIAAVH